ncbi:MAG TPA: RusA family crossover junction endodeoxyribonuclease [Solirubrobacteraceae bacterium]
MSDRLQLTVWGIPLPLQRSRTSSGRHYLPKRSRDYRSLVQAEWMTAGRPTLSGAPFTMSAQFYGANPRSDLDNLVKAALDALNGLAFTDDSQLACLSGCHKLAADQHGPRAEITLWALGRQQAA